MLLSQRLRSLTRPTTPRLEQWPWKVEETKCLATGGGTVLLRRRPDGANVFTFSFPLPPTHLLVIGQDLPDDVGLDSLLPANSGRWIAGVMETPNRGQAAVLAARRPAE